jgi:arabinogalactan oligomer/maltooligosaccharide transport system permease protein
VSLFPIVITFWLSFTNVSDFHPVTFSPDDDWRYIGLKNYLDAVGSLDGDFPRVFLSTVLYVIACVALFAIVGFATALALNNKKIKGLAFWRLGLILPWTVPSAITALIWKFLFHYDFGPINQLLRLGFGSGAGVPWLLQPLPAFIAVVIVNVWLSYPFFTVVILGALQSIPSELHESAEVDGASAWERFRYITLPLVRPAITPAILLSSITTFQMFNTVYLITWQTASFSNGQRPGFVQFVMIYVYDQILGGHTINRQFGFIGAISVMIFIILFLMTIFGLRVSRVSEEARA